MLRVSGETEMVVFDAITYESGPHSIIMIPVRMCTMTHRMPVTQKHIFHRRIV